MPSSLRTLTSFMSWSPRSSSSHTCVLTTLPASSSVSVASTNDLTVDSKGIDSNSATSAQVALPGVAVLAIACDAALRSPSGASASAFSMFAA